jgi:hypothetical protein
MMDLHLTGSEEADVLVEALDHYIDYLRGLPGDHVEDTADAVILRERVEALAD